MTEQDPTTVQNEGDDEIDLRLWEDGGEITGIELGFQVRFFIARSAAQLAIGGRFEIEWQDGTRSPYGWEEPWGSETTRRFFDAVDEARIVESRSSPSCSFLRVRLDSGVTIRHTPHGSPWEGWSAHNVCGEHFVGGVADEVTVFGGVPPEAGVPKPPQVPGASATPGDERQPDADPGDRLIDLEIGGRVRSVAVAARSIELQTRDGSIFLAGPFRLSWPDGTTAEFDPARKQKDKTTGRLLDFMIDNTVDLAALAPETSTLAVQFADGALLLWHPSSAANGEFRALHRSGRRFDSAGDGTVVWQGGPAGTPPMFLSGGPWGAQR